MGFVGVWVDLGDFRVGEIGGCVASARLWDRTGDPRRRRQIEFGVFVDTGVYKGMRETFLDSDNRIC